MDLNKVIGSNGQTKILHEYDIPESLSKTDGAPKKVALKQLTAEQELLASKLGRSDGRYDVTKAQYVATKLSIAEFDGKPANYADGDVDKFWERADPRLRSLLLQAYNKISAPTTEEEDSFFKSEVIKV